MKRRTRILIIALAASAMAATADAQVASAKTFDALYDKEAPLEVTGTIKRLDWGMPNVWIFLQNANAGGPVYGFSAGTPDSLARAGVNLTGVTQPLTVRGYRARGECGVHPDLGPACKAIARTVTMPNGCTVFIGLTGIEAPKDGLDPAEGGKAASCTPG